jgi:palmitoyl transferase
MNKILLILIGLILSTQTPASSTHACSKWPHWFKPICEHTLQTWSEGNNELYVTGYAWHNRYLYPSSRLNTYNEQAWGGGLGKSFYDPDGDWNGLYAFAFLDSHKNVEPIVGYAFVKMAHFAHDFRAGIGYGLLVTARPDIFHNIPFPGVLPLVTLGYQHLTLSATYIPGAQGAGNVLFIFARYVL